MSITYWIVTLLQILPLSWEIALQMDFCPTICKQYRILDQRPLLFFGKWKGWKCSGQENWSPVGVLHWPVESQDWALRKPLVLCWRYWSRCQEAEVRSLYQPSQSILLFTSFSCFSTTSGKSLDRMPSQAQRRLVKTKALMVLKGSDSAVTEVDESWYSAQIQASGNRNTHCGTWAQELVIRLSQVNSPNSQNYFWEKIILGNNSAVLCRTKHLISILFLLILIQCCYVLNELYLQLSLWLLRHIPCPLSSYSQKESLEYTEVKNIHFPGY